jgi:hypothetical protein
MSIGDCVLPTEQAALNQIAPLFRPFLALVGLVRRVGFLSGAKDYRPTRLKVSKQNGAAKTADIHQVFFEPKDLHR